MDNTSTDQELEKALGDLVKGVNADLAKISEDLEKATNQQ